MFKTFSKYILPLIAGCMLIFGAYHMVHSKQKFSVPKSTPPYAPARSPFRNPLAASGIVEPSTENIAVGSALSGVVLEVYVPAEKVGQRVKAGDPLFRVDDRQLLAQLAYNEANLAAAESQLDKLNSMPRPEEIPPSEAKVKANESNVAMMLDQYERANKLVTTHAIGIEEQVMRELKYRTAQQQLAQVKAEYKLLLAGAWKPDKAIANAAVAQAKAQVEQTKTDIERSSVRAPVDGNVLQVNVRPGEYVSSISGKALMVLGNLEQLRVRVDVDEYDIPRFRTNQPAMAFIRGDGDQKIEIKFSRVEPYVIPKRSLTGDNTERVDTRVLQVIYAIQPSDVQVYVGQQLDVYLDASSNGKSDTTAHESPGDQKPQAAPPVTPADG